MKNKWVNRGCTCKLNHRVDKHNVYNDTETTVLKVPKSIKISFNIDNNQFKDYVPVDTCLAEEISFLWHKGIQTRGCCCGHNEPNHLPYIFVHEKYTQDMVKLGYKRYPHKSDMFYPLTMKDEWSIK